MTSYRLALFIHIVGMIGFFMPLGAWLFGLVALRRARQTQQVRSICQAIFVSDTVAIVGILLLAGAGLYMAITTWGLDTGWVLVAIISFALLAPVGPLVVERRLHIIANLAAGAPDGPLPLEIRRRIADPIMGAGLALMIAWLLGIIFLMTTKPSLHGAILTMVVAAALGALGGTPLWRSRIPFQHPPRSRHAGQGQSQ